MTSEVCVAYILCVVGRRSVGTSGNSVEERDRKGENGSVGKIVEERENRRRERRERAAANRGTLLYKSCHTNFHSISIQIFQSPCEGKCGRLLWTGKHARLHY